MKEYFKEVEEESIRDNFVICYELLDELLDFGYPQTTDAKILQEYITQVWIHWYLTQLSMQGLWALGGGGGGLLCTVYTYYLHILSKLSR